MEPLQRRYEALQAVTKLLRVVTEPLRVVTQSLRSRYQSCEPLRSWAAQKSLCLTAAFAPVPAILGGSCPLGCSLSAPATGGFSVFSLQYSMYAAGSEKEKRAWGPLHWGHYSTPVRILQWGGGITWTGGMVLLWPAPSLGGGSGLACAVIPPAPPSNVLGYRGTRPVPPEGAAPPAPRAASVASLRWRIGTLPSLPPGTGTGTVFDCMLLSFSAEFRGFRRGAVVYPSLPVVSRRGCVA